MGYIDRSKWQKIFTNFLDQCNIDNSGFYDGNNDHYKTKEGGFENDIFKINPYYDGDDDLLREEPNFIYKPLNYTIKWYKNALRSAYADSDISDEEFAMIIRECKQSTKVKQIDIDYEQIDEKCRDMVKFFNDIGLDTKFSCQGHDNNLNNDYTIMFQDYITDYDIKDFIMKFENQYSHSPFLGKFTKWMRKINGEIQCNWQYTVDTGKYLSNQNRANEDLKTFKQVYNK